MSPGQRSGVAAAVVLLVAAVTAVLTLGRGPDGTGRTEVGRPAPSTAEAVDPEVRRAAAAGDALDALVRAVAERDRSAFAAVYAGPRGDRLFDILAALPLAAWDLRFVAEETVKPGSWTADVEARWSLRRFDERATSADVDVSFGRLARDGSTTIEGIRPDAQERLPEWLLGRTDVRRSRDALVLSARPGLTDRVYEQTLQAVRDVRQVLTDSIEPVVVVVPARTTQLESMLGGKPGGYDTIAAVTASVDGTADARAPDRVVVNPEVFGELGRMGAQVVLSHEATHAATEAATTQVPLWLVEGFADYVALADDPVPVPVAASQILRRVREEGVPRRLPTEGDFDAKAHGLGASYEAAWLICRMVAEREGEPTLVRFYERALATGETDAALRSVLGTTRRQLTRDWQAYLESLA